MKKVITRATVIEAIKTENLVPGKWFQDMNNVWNCSVCAVGAVIRKASALKYCDYNGLNVNDVIWDLVDGEEVTDSIHIPRLLKRKNYLAALSAKFESMFVRDLYGSVILFNSNEIKDKLIEWVKKNLPVKFTIELPDVSIKGAK